MTRGRGVVCGRTDEVGEGEMRVRGTVVVVACGGTRRSAVAVLPVWREVVGEDAMRVMGRLHRRTWRVGRGR